MYTCNSLQYSGLLLEKNEVETLYVCNDTSWLESETRGALQRQEIQTW